MEHEVFISHAHQDKSIAEAICQRLESVRVKCWISARDISNNEDWAEATRNAIASSHVMVLVLSENANVAPHVIREIAHAFYTRRIIIPFRLAGTFPRRDFLFYLGNVPWFNAASPPAEQHLEALTAHIKSLVSSCIVPGDAFPPQTAKPTTVTLNVSKSSMHALQASHYRTVGILRWGAIATALFAIGWLSWFTLWQTKERVSQTQSQLRPTYRGPSVSPKSTPSAGGDAPVAKPTDSLTRFGLWQGPNAGSPPLVQQTSQDTPSITPAEQGASVTGSTRSDVTPGQPAGVTSALEPHARPLPPPGVHRAPHYHHPRNQNARAVEPHRYADAVTRRGEILQNQLKTAENKLQTTQKSADLVAAQRDALQNELKENAARAQIARENAAVVTSQRDALRDQLKEAENRAARAEKNEELVTSQRDSLQKRLEETEAKARAAQNDADIARSQRDALQTRLKDAEAKAQMAQKNADLATRARDAVQTELGEAKENALLAEAHANLAVGQRNEMETELKKAEERAQLAQRNADLAVSQQSALEAQLTKIQEEKAQQLAQHDVDLARSHVSGPNTQSQRAREDSPPDYEAADLATNQPQSGQIQPPNPGQNVKLAPLTQVLDSSAQPARP